MIKYEPGQFYKVHHDQNSPAEAPPGPRVYTFFLYLSNVTAGGETRFPRLNLTVTPRVGSAVVWHSVRDDDVYADEPRTEHEALPVEEGLKYAANFWTHLRDFQTPHGARCEARKAVPAAIERKRQRSAAWRAKQKRHTPVGLGMGEAALDDGATPRLHPTHTRGPSNDEL